MRNFAEGGAVQHPMLLLLLEDEKKQRSGAGWTGQEKKP